MLLMVILPLAVPLQSGAAMTVSTSTSGKMVAFRILVTRQPRLVSMVSTTGCWPETLKITSCGPGPVAVCGTVFVSAGAAPALASLPILASLPVGALAAAVLVVNNVRDHRTDVVAGKRTLVVRLGRRFGVGLYFALIGLAYVVPVLLVLTARLSFFGLLPLLSAPLSLPLLRVVAVAHDGDRLNRTLAKTAQLLLVFGLLWVLAIGLS